MEFGQIFGHRKEAERSQVAEPELPPDDPVAVSAMARTALGGALQEPGFKVMASMDLKPMQEIIGTPIHHKQRGVSTPFPSPRAFPRLRR